MKDPVVYIKHVFDSILKIEKFTKGFTKEKFFQDELLQDAVIRRIEVIGESVKNIPKEFRDKHMGIPWSNIAGMRDKLMHHYFGVNLETVWKVVEESIPVLKKQMKEILDNE
jgi:uncharacterized protein with HEPN domain